MLQEQVQLVKAMLVVQVLGRLAAPTLAAEEAAARALRVELLFLPAPQVMVVLARSRR